MNARTTKTLAAVAILAVAGIGTWLAYRGPTPAAPRPPTLEGPTRAGSAQPAAPAAPRRYRPEGPLPAQAIPGGGLAAHEGEDAGHTLARHVGRTIEELRERLVREERRETSTFPDLATAERVVARTLYEKRRAIQAWLDKGATGDQLFLGEFDEAVGQVLKAGAEAPVTGRTVYVVLYASNLFPAGFAIRAAYVRTP